MSSPQHLLSWVLSLALHIFVLVGGAYFAVGTHVKIDLNKRMYEVSLVGAPNKGKPGARSAQRPGTPPQETRQKPPSKAAPEAKPVPEQKKPEKKAIPPDTAKPIPKETVNATQVAEAKPEEKPKSEAKKEEKKPDSKKEAPKKEAPKKTEKAPSKEDILAQALKDASKTAKSSSRSSTSGKSTTSKGSSKDALADALADLGKEVSGRGTRGDGRAEDGDGTGESSGSLADYYATQVVRVVRPNWRYPGRSAVELVASVELKINKAGQILAARVIRSSGRSDYDASIMRGIEETKQLPPLPDTLPTTLIINFSSNEML